ncbi:MAG TPA: hypothetical protein VML55_05895 [Planctomycetaceae bacterium]|nr:hypothetical protein [Planctomycetaceae bacterium]
MNAPLLAVGGSNAALVTFLLYTLAVFGLAAASNRLLQKKSFLSEYFLGSRGLGMWAFALTFAATSASGGSFTGFPSKIYSHGWILGLWIGSYIVVPICAMGLLGKRINHVARLSGAITVPDVLRDRFRSAHFGLLAVGLIAFFMTFNLVAQFKAGAVILNTLLEGVELYEQAAIQLRRGLASVAFLGGESGLLYGADPEYLLCLLGFGVAVIIYTTYGGFRAVVWTDVMQGVVMVCGVLVMLPLALMLAGRQAPAGTPALEYVTREMAEMTPPRRGHATLSIDRPRERPLGVLSGTWITTPRAEPAAQARLPDVAVERDGDARPRLFRVTAGRVIPAGDTTVHKVDVLEILTPADVDRVLNADTTRLNSDLELSDLELQPYAYGADGRKGVYVTGPGPDPERADGFLPLSLAISFFFMWAISGSGQPSSMVRLMAFKDTLTLRRSIFTVAIYYSAIYFPLVVIFCCARVLMPGMDAESDRIMPAMAVHLTSQIGMAWLAGLLIAAPFAAVMSTVDSFLLMISSALVRDIYQRNINPQAQERTIKRLSYLFTLLVGVAAMLGAANPPQFLQDIIVYTGSGLAACFLGPMVFALYWPRANAAGCMAGMLAGFATHLSMYVGGLFANGSFFRPYQVFDFDPIVVGLLVSFATTYFATRLTAPPPEDLVRKYFYRVS